MPLGFANLIRIAIRTNEELCDNILRLSALDCSASWLDLFSELPPRRELDNLISFVGVTGLHNDISFLCKYLLGLGSPVE